MKETLSFLFGLALGNHAKNILLKDSVQSITIQNAELKVYLMPENTLISTKQVNLQLHQWIEVELDLNLQEGAILINNRLAFQKGHLVDKQNNTIVEVIQ